MRAEDLEGTMGDKYPEYRLCHASGRYSLQDLHQYGYPANTWLQLKKSVPDVLGNEELIAVIVIKPKHVQETIETKCKSQ